MKPKTQHHAKEATGALSVIVGIGVVVYFLARFYPFLWT